MKKTKSKPVRLDNEFSFVPGHGIVRNSHMKELRVLGADPTDVLQQYDAQESIILAKAVVALETLKKGIPSRNQSGWRFRGVICGSEFFANQTAVVIGCRGYGWRKAIRMARLILKHSAAE